MFDDNELIITNRKFLNLAYIFYDQIQIFRERMFLQNEFRSKKCLSTRTFEKSN